MDSVDQDEANTDRLYLHLHTQQTKNPLHAAHVEGFFTALCKGFLHIEGFTLR